MAYSYKKRQTAKQELTVQNPEVQALTDQSRSEQIIDGNFYFINDGGKAQNSSNNPWRIPSFFHAVRDTASAVARTTCLVKKEDTNEIDKKHDAYWLLNWKASKFVDSIEFIRAMVVSAIAYGDGYAFIERDDGINPSSLNVLDTRITDCVYEYDGASLVDVHYIHMKDGNEIRIPYEDVIHLKNLSLGVDPDDDPINVPLMYDAAITKANSIQKFQNLYFENGTLATKVLKVPGWLTDDQKAKLKADLWHENGGINNSGKLTILQGQTELQVVPLNSQDMELVNSADQILTDVANATSTPGTRIGARGAISYGSLAQDNLLFVQNLDNWYTPFESELSIKLLKYRQQGMTHYIEFDRNTLLVSDPDWQRLQMEKYAAKIITLDEIRLKLGESLIPLGDFEEAHAPVVAPNPPEDVPPQPQTPEDSSPNPGAEDQTRGLKLVENILSRFKKRIIKSVEAKKTDLSKHHKLILNELRGLNCEPVMAQLNTLQAELDASLPEQYIGAIKRWNHKQTAAKIWS